MTRNVLEPGEMVTLPEDASDWSGDYQKLRQRESGTSLKRALLFSEGDEGDVPSSLRVATTGLESIPGCIQKKDDAWRIGAELRPSKFYQSRLEGSKACPSTWFSPSYRRKMVKVLTKGRVGSYW